jgi:hypothetical protein
VVDQIKNRALAAIDDTVITEYEIYQQIQKILPLTSDAEKKQFAKSLIQTINASAGKILTSDQIIDLAGQRIKADAAQIEIIKTEVEKSTWVPLSRQSELNILLNSNHLTLGERNLLKEE